MGIDTYSFMESEIENLKTQASYSNWPVVYLLNDTKRVYIGETVNIHRRIKEHHQDGVRKTLKKINIIYDDQFNKSATLNIETKLIEYMSADKNFKIMNGNGGQRKHDFFEKKKVV